MLHIIRVFNTFILSYSYTLNFSWESITHDKTKRENQIDFFLRIFLNQSVVIMMLFFISILKIFISEIL